MKKILFFLNSSVALLASLMIISLPAVANSISQSYKSENTLPTGSLVSLTGDGSNNVEKTTTENEGLVIGVVVDGSGSLVDIQSQNTDVRVAINGDVELLVSTQNGNIAKGDYLIASPLAGISTKDSPTAKNAKYIAIASEEFSEVSSGAKNIEIKEEGDKTRTVSVGYINAKLIIGDRPAAERNKDDNFLTDIASKVARRSVSTLQAVAAVAIFILGFSITAVLLHGSIKSSFISIGRNPLSRDSILTGLARVVLLAILIIITSVTSAYLILII
jgi:hypothetical protein